LRDDRKRFSCFPLQRGHGQRSRRTGNQTTDGDHACIRAQLSNELLILTSLGNLSQSLL
jgi:hypothetical protein